MSAIRKGDKHYDPGRNLQMCLERGMFFQVPLQTIMS